MFDVLCGAMMNQGVQNTTGNEKFIDGKKVFYMSYAHSMDNGPETALVFVGDDDRDMLIMNGKRDLEGDVSDLVEEWKVSEQGYTTGTIEQVEKVIGMSIEEFVNKFDK